jgi:hypothetical protein
MKKITATLTALRGTTQITLAFETLPGMSLAQYVTISGEPLAEGMPPHFFAETNERSLTQLAETLGAELAIEASGEWEVFTE